MKVKCPECAVTLKLPDGAAGRQLRCPKCRHVFKLRGSNASAPTPPAAAEPSSPLDQLAAAVAGGTRRDQEEQTSIERALAGDSEPDEPSPEQVIASYVRVYRSTKQAGDSAAALGKVSGLMFNGFIREVRDREAENSPAVVAEIVANYLNTWTTFLSAIDGDGRAIGSLLSGQVIDGFRSRLKDTYPDLCDHPALVDYFNELLTGQQQGMVSALTEAVGVAPSQPATVVEEASPARTTCPHCTTTLQLPDGAAGKKLRCPKCQQVFTAKAPAARRATPVVEDDEPSSPLDELAAAVEQGPVASRQDNAADDRPLDAEMLVGWCYEARAKGKDIDAVAHLLVEVVLVNMAGDAERVKVLMANYSESQQVSTLFGVINKFRNMWIEFATSVSGVDPRLFDRLLQERSPDMYNNCRAVWDAQG